MLILFDKSHRNQLPITIRKLTELRWLHASYPHFHISISTPNIFLDSALDQFGAQLLPSCHWVETTHQNLSVSLLHFVDNFVAFLNQALGEVPFCQTSLDPELFLFKCTLLPHRVSFKAVVVASAPLQWPQLIHLCIPFILLTTLYCSPNRITDQTVLLLRFSKALLVIFKKAEMKSHEKTFIWLKM